MQLPRFRFTIGQLIKLIAASAVGFAVLPTHYWLPIMAIVLATGLCLVGFTIERAQDGPGYRGDVRRCHRVCGLGLPFLRGCASGGRLASL